MSVFGRFAPRLQQAIVARLGWTSLRPVQELAGEALLAGKNAVILAPTAGGKTEAAMFPVLSELVTRPPRGVAALYVAPIKALLNNQAERLGVYAEMVGLRRFVWHGDTSSSERKQFLAEPAEILMTTPESLEVMLISQRVDAAALFADVRVVVIDEIHALAGTDRGGHLLSVLERVARCSGGGSRRGSGGDEQRGLGGDIQRIGLSATVGNPEAILAWMQGSSRRGAEVVRPPREPAKRQLLVVHRPDLAALARDAAKMARGQKSLFFCQSRSMAEAVAEHMRRAGTEVFVHHSAVSREERELAEERFHRGSDACIVCTSTLELGIDVGDLDKVLQAEAPDTVSSFLQRMGRTGRRAGQVANTTFLCETADGVLQAVALVELAREGWVEAVAVRTRAWPVLVHQLLALALAESGVPVEDAWAHMVRVPDLAGIRRAEFDRLVAWMLRDGSLVMASGRLVLGPKAERRFGRRNFMDLYAVFSSPQSYVVVTRAGQSLGTLNQGFVDRLVEDVSCFLLSGRAWLVVQIRHDERQIVVETAPRGRQPTWGGFLPQFLGFEVCQRILRILTAGVDGADGGDGVGMDGENRARAVSEEYRYLHADAAAVVVEKRQSFAGLLQPGRGGVEFESGEIRWWTFAGGRINTTLRFALEVLLGWKAVADNYMIRLRGDSLGQGEFWEAVERLTEIETWDDERFWANVVASLPGYRLSKFQPLMPPWVEREMLAEYLLDVEGAWRWVSGEAGADGKAAARARTAMLRVLGGEKAEAAPSVRPELGVAVQIKQDAVLRLEEEATLRPRRSVQWIASDAELLAVCEVFAEESVLGLDVETTLGTRALCLVQVAGRERIALIDALAISDLSPLGGVLGNPNIVKVIHNASFERSVLGVHGIEIKGVFDTLAASRRLRGYRAEGGHRLDVVCQRELGIDLDKSAQTTDWTRRPLSPVQLAYAALDAEVLLGLYEALRDTSPLLC